MHNERINGPIIKPIQQVALPLVSHHQLDNQIDIYEISGGTQDVIKLEIIIQAGRPYEKVRTSARTIASLLKEGTNTRTAEQIANAFEYYGASIITTNDIDFTKISMYCLSKHFDALIPVVIELLMEPSFNESELELYKSNICQKLQVDLTKSDVLAYRKFTEQIFGVDHPYGYNSTAEQYQELTREQLLSEYKQVFGANRCKAFISGKVTAAVRNSLFSHLQSFGQIATRSLNSMAVENKLPTNLSFDSPNEYQSAIRIGKRLFKRDHPDYAGMSVLTTLLGGYFGSRLMANIREEKGYTYNIYSSIDNMIFDGYFYISTEVGKEYASQTIDEIHKEINILRTELVPEEELTMVKNYLAGNYLNMLDGPLKSSRVVRNIISSGLPLSYYEDILAKTLTIKPEELLQLADEYLDLESMTQVVV